MCINNWEEYERVRRPYLPRAYELGTFGIYGWEELRRSMLLFYKKSDIISVCAPVYYRCTQTAGFATMDVTVGEYLRNRRMFLRKDPLKKRLRYYLDKALFALILVAVSPALPILIPIYRGNLKAVYLTDRSWTYPILIPEEIIYA